jgi:dTDP-4-dehydrorhamnose reductase
LIKSNEEKILTLPYDQYATPTYAGDIAKMIYMLLSENKDGLYNLSSTDYYSRYQLAKKIKSYFGGQNRLKLEPISTMKLKQKANRPLNGGLVNVKFLNEFPDFEFTNVDKFIIKSLENEL